MPIVSIIIPTYNRASLIKETLDSIFWQSFYNWECIIVDDGSTDSTVEVVNNFINKDKRFKLVERYREPKGAPTCRNIGLEISNSEYVIFFDSDDILLPWAIEERLKGFERNLSFDACLSQGFLVFGKKTPQLRNNPNEIDFFEEISNFRTTFSTPCPIWRKEFLIKNARWKEGLPRWQDPVFHTTCLVKGMRYTWIQKIPDHLIRSDFTDNTRITATKGSFDSFHKLLEGFIEVYILLPDKYKNDFKKSVINKVWKTSFFLKKPQINLVSSLLLECNIFNPLYAFKFRTLSILHFYLKKTPIIRKVLFELIRQNIFEETKTIFPDTSKIIQDFNSKLKSSCSADILGTLKEFQLHEKTNL